MTNINQAALEYLSNKFKNKRHRLFREAPKIQLRKKFRISVGDYWNIIYHLWETMKDDLTDANPPAPAPVKIEVVAYNHSTPLRNIGMHRPHVMPSYALAHL